MLIRVRVHPGSGSESVSGRGDGLEVWVREPAEGNRANIATIKLLSRHFGRPVKMVAGLRSRKKLVEVEGLKEKIHSHGNGAPERG